MSEQSFNEGSGSRDSLARWVAAGKAKAARFQQMRAGVAQIAVTETSSDGVVTVTVDAGGNVTDLRVTDGASGWPGTKISTVVLTTMRRAQAKLADRVAEVMTGTVGDEPSALDAVLTNYHSKFPQPPPDEPSRSTDLPIGQSTEPTPPPVPAPQPSRAADPATRHAQSADGEDWGESDRSFMSRGY
jgi:DNA-binding protein YbaB